MSLVTLADAQARVGDQVTQDQIDEVEDGLRALVGPLVGERTETFELSRRRYFWRSVDGLYLSRRTDLAVVTNQSTGDSPSSLTAGTDYRLLDHFLVERIHTGAIWLDTLAATYTPNDEEIVRSVIFDWLAYRQTPTGVQSIRIGAFSETYFPGGSGGTTSTDPVVQGFVRRLLPLAGIGITSPYRYEAHRRDRTLVSGGDAS